MVVPRIIHQAQGYEYSGQHTLSSWQQSRVAVHYLGAKTPKTHQETIDSRMVRVSAMCKAPYAAPGHNTNNTGTKARYLCPAVSSLAKDVKLTRLPGMNVAPKSLFCGIQSWTLLPYRSLLRYSRIWCDLPDCFWMYGSDLSKSNVHEWWSKSKSVQTINNMERYCGSAKKTERERVFGLSVSAPLPYSPESLTLTTND